MGAYLATCQLTTYASEFTVANNAENLLKERIETYCSILSDYEPFTVDGSNPKEQCDWCSSK